MNFINNTKQDYPFEYYTFKDVFSEEELNAIEDFFEKFTAPLEKESNTVGKRTSYSNRMYLTSAEYKAIPIAKLLVDSLLSFFSPMYKSTDQESLYLRVELLRDKPGFWLEPHVDIPEKKLSMMIYINPKNIQNISGTVLYDNNKTIVQEIPYVNNTGFYFFPNKNTWHGVNKLENGPRFSVMVNVCTFETDFKI